MSDDAIKQRILARRAQLVAAAITAVGGAAMSCEPSVRPAQTVIIGPAGSASVDPLVIAIPEAGAPIAHGAPDAGGPPAIADNVEGEPDAGPAPVPCLSPPRPCVSPPPRPCLKPVQPPPRICLSMDAP